jgi:hypothetical protein
MSSSQRRIRTSRPNCRRSSARVGSRSSSRRPTRSTTASTRGKLARSLYRDDRKTFEEYVLVACEVVLDEPRQVLQATTGRTCIASTTSATSTTRGTSRTATSPFRTSTAEFGVELVELVLHRAPLGKHLRVVVHPPVGVIERVEGTSARAVRGQGCARGLRLAELASPVRPLPQVQPEVAR